MVLRGINRAASVGYQTAPYASPALLCGLYQFVSHTEGITLLLEFEWLL